MAMRTGPDKRIFVNEKIEEGNFILEDSQIINRIQNVLRLRVDDEIILFNSERKEWLAKIIDLHKKRIVFDVSNPLERSENEMSVVVAFSPIKQERMKFLLEKCTEIGITKFIPIIFDRTIVRKVSQEKLHSYVVSACEQSGRVSVPEITNQIDLQHFLKKYTDAEIIFCDEKESDFLINKVTIKDRQIIIVGPEGGVTDQERKLLKSEKNVYSVSLGKNILRAETAAIFATSYFAALQQ